MNGEGWVYLLHFGRPYVSSGRPYTDPSGKRRRGERRISIQHYIGWTDDLDRRVTEHVMGRSRARIMEVVRTAGIPFALPLVWRGDQTLEKRLKATKRYSRFCPVCQGEVFFDDLPVRIVQNGCSECYDQYNRLILPLGEARQYTQPDLSSCSCLLIPQPWRFDGVCPSASTF